MNELSETEKAYLAGIIDGEGCILVTRVTRPANRSGYRYYPSVTVISTSRSLLDWIQEKTGTGTVHNRKESNIRAKRKCWRWMCKHSICGEFLRQLLPYMVIKADSAQNCIDFCEASVNRGNYGKYDLDKMVKFWEKSHELNMRGEYLDDNDPPTSTQGRTKAIMRPYRHGVQSSDFQEVMMGFARGNGHYPNDPYAERTTP